MASVQIVRSRLIVRQIAAYLELCYGVTWPFQLNTELKLRSFIKEQHKVFCNNARSFVVPCSPALPKSKEHSIFLETAQAPEFE